MYKRFLSFCQKEGIGCPACSEKLLHSVGFGCLGGFFSAFIIKTY